MLARPKDPSLEKRLLESGWDILAEGGFDALSMSEVATRAGAHRSDVYRRWTTKTQLVAEVLAAHLPSVKSCDTGDLREDLRHFLDDLSRSWRAPWTEGLVGFLAELPKDPEAEVTFLNMAKHRSQPLTEAVTRALRRGEITELPDLALLQGLAEGPLMHKRLIGRQAMTPSELDLLADTITAVATQGSPTR
ncbi:TetR/AcrR family transcriptional regulator [Brevibacterium sp. S111]|nr:TetR/AcrR family transcriptional regulator [Brevibacterium sp. S111]